MSIKVMTMVFDRYPEGGSERLLALAIADHARDDGTRIWPSIDELARKTLQSRSTVQRQIRRMIAIGWLVPKAAGTGRGRTNEYGICPAWIDGGPLPSVGDAAGASAAARSPEVIHKGVKMTPFPGGEKGVTQDVKGVIQNQKGVTAMTPESSEPSRTISPLPPDGGASGFERFRAAYPKAVRMLEAERRWRRMNPSPELLRTMLAALAVQRQSARWKREEGRGIPDAVKWLRNKGWLDDFGGVLPADWWESSDGVKAMGLKLGMPFSLAALGNAYTDDQRLEHWRAYRGKVLAAAGDGPWSQRRAA